MKIFSILGDSISTFYGFNPQNFSVYYDRDNCRINGLKSEKDTWWGMVIDYYDGRLGINNSYSGSTVSGRYFPAANQFSRLECMKVTQETQYLLIYMGFNDFGRGVKLHAKKLCINNIEYFCDAYKKMLINIKKILPNTSIICGTLMKTYIAGKVDWLFPENYNNHVLFEDYNEVIREVCRSNSIALADLATLNVKYETLDGTHPTVVGHKEIAKAWISIVPQLF